MPFQRQSASRTVHSTCKSQDCKIPSSVIRPTTQPSMLSSFSLAFALSPNHPVHVQQHQQREMYSQTSGIFLRGSFVVGVDEGSQTIHSRQSSAGFSAGGCRTRRYGLCNFSKLPVVFTHRGIVSRFVDTLLIFGVLYTNDSSLYFNGELPPLEPFCEFRQQEIVNVNVRTAGSLGQ